VRFNGAENDKLLGVLHEIAEEDKGKKLAFEGFGSPPPIDAMDVEVNPLYVIFDLKKVLVGKDYFIINHLMPLPFNLTQGCTLLGKNIVPRPTLKEFFMRCLEQLIVYIWTFVSLAKMNAYLRKIAKEIGLEINRQKIIG
jgi:hypothetical protein